MLSKLQIKALFQSLEDIGASLRYLVDREQKKQALGGRRLAQYHNPHYSEVIEMVETILADTNKTMTTKDLYPEMVRRGMEIRSVNPAKYLATLLDRDQHKAKSKIFRVTGSNRGWRLKAVLTMPVEQVERADLRSKPSHRI